jgi:hypothetical protein
MSNAETILEFLEGYPKGVCDNCISRETRVQPRQQVNQICRRLEQKEEIMRRAGRCALGDHTKMLNIIRAATCPPGEGGRGREGGTTVSIEALWKHLDRFCKGLGEKHGISTGRQGLAALVSALTDSGAIPMHQANMMHAIRSLRNAYVHDHIVVGKRETEFARAAWDIIHEWAESRESELWGRTRP